jgi:hypothetical protein
MWLKIKVALAQFRLSKLKEKRKTKQASRWWNKIEQEINDRNGN